MVNVKIEKRLKFCVTIFECAFCDLKKGNSMFAISFISFNIKHTIRTTLTVGPTPLSKSYISVYIYTYVMVGSL